MARHRRLVAAAALATTLAAGLAACSTGASTVGGKGGTPPPTTPHTAVTPTHSAPTTKTPPTTTQPPKPVSITMVMSGDVLLHQGLWYTAQHDAARTGRGAMDYRPLLANMRSVISSADFAICHLETPLAPLGGPYSGYPTFSVPPQILPALKWEGFDACTTMSNHSLDDGWTGLVRTIDDFNKIGLKHFGTVKTKAESTQPLMVNVNGVKVALIGATYGTNGIPLPEDEPWSVPIIDVDKIEAMAHTAREEGAQIVIVALHWGLEYDHEPISDQTTVADALTKDKDITFIYGHHAHVVQPFAKVNGTWVVYGLGNAVAQQETDQEGVYDGVTARVTFTGTPGEDDFSVSKLQYIPTMITPYDYSDPTAHPMRWLDIPKDLDDPAYAALRPQMLADQKAVRDDVNLLGALKLGVTEGR